MIEMEPGTEITLQENKAISEISQERLPLFQPTAEAALHGGLRCLGVR